VLGQTQGQQRLLKNMPLSRTMMSKTRDTIILRFLLLVYVYQHVI
jgi:hypothetical protein